MIIPLSNIVNSTPQPPYQNEVREKKSSTRSIRIPAMLTSALLMLASYAKADVTPSQSTASASNTTTVIEFAKSALGKGKKGDYEGAIKDYDKMIKLSPQNELFYQTRGELYYKKGDFGEAIRNYAIAASKYIHKKEALISQLKNSTSPTDTDRLNDEIEAYENAIKVNMERIRTFRKIKKTGFDYTTARDFDIEEVHQGQMMNCYFLSLLCKFPDLIEKSKCLKWNKDGSAEVSLYPVKLDNAKRDFSITGKRKTYHISNEELNASLFKFTKADGKLIPFKLNSAQDMTLKALEIGFLKNLNGDFVSCNKGGESKDALKMLFGGYIIPDVGRIITGQSDFDREDIKNGIYLSLFAQNGKYSSGNCRPVEICGHKFVPNHTYIVNSYNPANDTVSLSNPYFDDRNSKADDIVIPFEEIVKNHFHLDFIIPKK